ncbi:RNA polymerase sigma factor [Tautonia sociabilis]|uniref:Uncharacterized protein n=1 Tax=Tautonia sociabilis TaxID=2080755 RepID=A0A432MEP5_9BACT|nr:sigma-70 family RNA polymerase sigma factor [Tautonia sociabilis]RUL84032.1 hypothetical protein TsocGM_21155 [Tautonia sociabilis]
MEPLTSNYRDGRPYTRRRDVEDQVCRVRDTDPATWPALAKAPAGSDDRLKSEVIVHLVRILRARGETAIAGQLIEQLVKRMEKTATAWAKGFDQTTTEEIVIQVGERVVELILADTPSRQSEFLEVAFAEAVKRRTLNAVERRESQPRTYRFATPTDAGDGSDGTVANPLEGMADGEPSPEEIAIARERPDVLRRCLGAISNPKHREAVVLRFFEGWPIVSKDKTKPSLCTHFGISDRQISNWFAKAFEEVRAMAGDSL